MSIPWRDMCSDISSALSYARKKEIYVDVQFWQGKLPCLYAHKLVLALWSPRFAQWMKQGENRETPVVFSFNEDIAVMDAVLDYLYSSPDPYPFYSKISVEKLIEALDITERLCINHLHKRCLDSLQSRKIVPSNVITILDYGLRKNLESTVRKCVKVLATQGVFESSLPRTASLDTVMSLLKLDRIAIESEGTLLCLAMSWLSHPPNMQYKSEVLSLVDLFSIEWIKYQGIWKKFPGFFTDSERSSILLAVSQQDQSLFPDWYMPRVLSVIEQNCDVCVVVRKQLRIPSSHLLNFPTDRKDITQEFAFDFEDYYRGRLLSVELGIGPSDVPEGEFTVKFKRQATGQWRECNLDCAKKIHRYTLLFPKPLKLNQNDSLHLRFNLLRGLKDNKMKYTSPNIIEREKINVPLDEGAVKVQLKSSNMAFYCGSPKDPKFLVSSFCFSFCDEHNVYLKRKLLKPELNEFKSPQLYNVVIKSKMTGISKIKEEKNCIE